MENHQVHVIEQLAQKLQLGQGDIMRLAHEIAHEEIPTLYDLNRAQADRLIVHLDSLLLAGVR
jgi:ATP-dependent protease HslVU (ClpYQ) peptidase subunit